MTYPNNISFDCLIRYDYLYGMELFVKILLGIFLLTIICSMIISFLFDYFPTSSLTNWVRRHIVTDEDLEDNS